ncbi:MAG: hypothetical protein JXR83_02425 [Deltaproteobacteria bacterium]|nr:hypothetical protein [Deltaproteobacteria bacterium]
MTKIESSSRPPALKPATNAASNQHVQAKTAAGGKPKAQAVSSADQVERDTVHAAAPAAASAGAGASAAAAETSTAGPPRQMRRALSRGLVEQQPVAQGASPYRAADDAAGVAADAEQRAQADAASVQRAWDDAIRAGKSEAEAANAAASRLEELARAADDPEYVARLTEAAGPTLDRIADVVGRAAANDLDRDKDLLKETVKSLAAVADIGGGDEIARRLAGELPDDTQLQEVDDALLEHIGAGGSTELARQLHDELRRAGKTEAARGLADNEHGDDLELLVIREARARLDAGESPAAIADRYGSYLCAHVAESVASGHNEDSEEAVKLLADLADSGGPQVAARLGRDLAARVPDQSDLHKLDDALHDFAKEGRGLALTNALVSELSALGKTRALEEMRDVAHVAVERALETYNDAQARYAEREAALAGDLAMFGTGMTDAERQKYIDAFWADPENKAIKDAYSAAESRLSSTMRALGPALEAQVLAGDEKAGEVLLDGMKALAASPGGGRQAIDFVERLGRPENLALFEALNRDGKLEDRLADDVLAPAVGTAQSQALTDGSMDGLYDQLKSIQRTAKNFKSIPDLIAGAIEMRQQVADLLAQGLSGADIASRLRLDRLTEGWESKGKLGKAMAVFAIVGALQRAGEVEGGLDKLQESLKAVRGGLELTAGILGTLGRAGKLAGAETAGRLIGKYLPFVSFAIDGLQLKDDIQKLLNGGNAGDYIATVGTVINLVGDVCGVVPVAGTMVDGILTVVGSIVQGLGGMISGLISGNEEREKRQAARERYLTAAGVSAENRDLMLNGGPVDLAALGTMGFSREQFLDVLRAQRDLPTDDQLKSAYAMQMSWQLAAIYGLKGDDAMRFTAEMQEQIQDMSWLDLDRLNRAIGDVVGVALGVSGQGKSTQEVQQALAGVLDFLDDCMQNFAGDVYQDWQLEHNSESDVNVAFLTAFDHR